MRLRRFIKNVALCEETARAFLATLFECDLAFRRAFWCQVIGDPAIMNAWTLRSALLRSAARLRGTIRSATLTGAPNVSVAAGYAAAAPVNGFEPRRSFT